MPSPTERSRRRRRRRAGTSERARVATARLYFSGFGLEAIAAATGVSEKAVKRCLRGMGVVVV